MADRLHLNRWIGGRRSRFVGGDTGRIGLGLLCIALIVYVQLHAGNFVTSNNFDNILNNLTAALFVAAAAAPLLISGNVDLSVGGMLSLISVVSAKLGVETQSVVVMLGSAVLLGAICGFANGVLVRFLRLSPIIVTIGTGGIFAGFAYLISNNGAIFGFPNSVVEVGREYVFGIPMVAAVAALVFAISGLILTFTVTGLRTYAIGGNREAARQAGIQVDRQVTMLYVLTGVAVAVAALALTARLGSGSPDTGTSFEIDLLTALILGGIGFTGGTGRPLGIAVGLITIEVFNAAAIFLGFSDYFHQVARGAILLLALAGDQLVERYRQRKGARQTVEEAEVAEVKDAALNGAGVGRVERQPGRVRAAVDRSDAAHRTAPILALGNITKTYGGVAAVSDVSLELRRGQITCLVGDNGAGKSTLVKLMTGVVRPDDGEMRLEGESYAPHSPGDARRVGVEAVYQDLALAPNLGAGPNLVLGDEPLLGPAVGPFSIIDRRAVADRAAKRLRTLSVHLQDLNLPVSSLSGGQRQSVAIARAARPGVRLAVLDEPTAALGVGQRRTVLDLIRRLADEDVGVVVVSHDIENVMEIADRVIVMRLGRIAFDGSIDQLDMERLVLLMAGIDKQPELSGAK